MTTQTDWLELNMPAEGDTDWSTEINTNWATIDEAIRSGYSSDAVITVERGDTDAASGTNLKAAYAAAKSLTPGGNALSATNRAVVRAPAGRYDFGTTALDLDTDFIDLIGEGIARVDLKTAITWAGDPYASAVSAINVNNAEFHMPDTVFVCDTDDEVVNVTCRDILMKGFHIEHETSEKVGLRVDNANACDRGRFIDIGVTTTVGYAIDDGTNTTIAAYFEQCHSKNPMLYLAGGEISGTCVNCTGGITSFSETASGTFVNCVAGLFGSNFGPTASGTFINCVTGSVAFGGHGTASGTFINCYAKQYSFGGGAATSTASGTFRNCYSGNSSFGGGISTCTASGTFIECEGGTNSFGGVGTASGTFIDCVGGAGSFSGGSDSGTSARMTRCRATGQSDAIKKWQGTMEDCVIEVTGTDKHAVEVTGAANFIGCTLTANGTGNGVYASSAQTVHLSRSSMNKDLGTNVTADTSSSWNVNGVWHGLGVELPDNQKVVLGSGSDAELYYDGTDLVVDPKAVGGGATKMLGDVNINSNDVTGVNDLTGDGSGVASGFADVVVPSSQPTGSVGSVYFDDTNDRLYVKTTDGWKYVDLT